MVENIADAEPLRGCRPGLVFTIIDGSHIFPSDAVWEAERLVFPCASVFPEHRVEVHIFKRRRSTAREQISWVTPSPS